MFVGRAVGGAGRSVVVQHDEREFPVHGRQQILIFVERFGHVLGTVEDPEVLATEPEGDPGERPVVRPVFGASDRVGDQGSDGVAVRFGIHAVYRTGRASDQRAVRCKYTFFFYFRF